MSRNFLLYSVFIGFLMGAVTLSGPFFNVWYLRDLKFDYLTFSINSISIVAGMVLFLPLWGKLSDHIGPFRVLKLTGILLAIIPLPFLFIKMPLVIWCCNFYGGVVWSGFNLCNFNYLLQSSGREHPEQHLAVATTISGLFMFLFGLLGGYLATRVPVLFAWQLQTLFLISMILRVIAVLLIITRLKPVVIKPAPYYYSSIELFDSFPGFSLGMGIMRKVVRVFRRQ
jgi:MFS family permease